MDLEYAILLIEPKLHLHPTLNGSLNAYENKALHALIEGVKELIEIKKMMQDEFNKVREGGKE